MSSMQRGREEMTIVMALDQRQGPRPRVHLSVGPMAIMPRCLLWERKMGETKMNSSFLFPHLLFQVIEDRASRRNVNESHADDLCPVLRRPRPVRATMPGRAGEQPQGRQALYARHPAGVERGQSGRGRLRAGMGGRGGQALRSAHPGVSSRAERLQVSAHAADVPRRPWRVIRWAST